MMNFYQSFLTYHLERGRLARTNSLERNHNYNNSSSNFADRNS